MNVRRTRLVTGLLLLTYLATHLLNHALGLISLRVLEVGRTGFVFIWHNPVGQTVLYGALFTHFFLALWSLYRRRALRLSYWEWTQLVLGALIIQAMNTGILLSGYPPEFNLLVKAVVVIAVLLLQSPRLAGFSAVAGFAARLRGAKA